MPFGDLIERYRKSFDDLKERYKPWNVSTPPTTNSTSMVPQVNSPLSMAQEESMKFPTNRANPAVQKAIQPMEEPDLSLGQKLQAQGPVQMAKEAIQGAQDQATLYAQGMRQGLGASTESQARQMGYEGQFSPEASQSFAEQSTNLVMGSTGELGAAAKNVGKKVAKNFVPKIDLPTQKEMIEVIDYARLKPGFNQRLEENASVLAEKFGIRGNSIGNIADKFDDVLQKIRAKKGYTSAFRKKPPVVEQELRSVGVVDYRASHQIDSSASRPASSLSNLDEIVKEAKTKSGYLTKYDLLDLSKLRKIQNAPEADIKIYRASPKNELNHGDWVTTSRTYANDIKAQNGGKVHVYTVKAGDLRYPNDTKDMPSLARFSAFKFEPNQ